MVILFEVIAYLQRQLNKMFDYAYAQSNSDLRLQENRSKHT